jgi:cell division transport system ATP-binding protein
MIKTIIQFDQVSKIYGDIKAINNLSFIINKGELVFLAGKSGAGKSTILQLTAGILKSSSGNITINGINLNTLNSNRRSIIRQHVGFIFQDHKLLYDRNNFDNVKLPLEIIGYDKKYIKDSVDMILEKVGLKDKIYKMPYELSGGEQQRLCIARAMIHNPRILLADEPTANLDYDNAFLILELFKLFHKNGVTIIISAHDKTILNDYGTRILNIQNGQFKG